MALPRNPVLAASSSGIGPVKRLSGGEWEAILDAPLSLSHAQTLLQLLRPAVVAPHTCAADSGVTMPPRRRRYQPTDRSHGPARRAAEERRRNRQLESDPVWVVSEHTATRSDLE